METRCWAELRSAMWVKTDTEGKHMVICVKVTWKISGVMHQWIMKGNKKRNSNKENLFTLLLFEINLVNLHEGRVDMCLAFEWWNMTINACKRYMY